MSGSRFFDRHALIGAFDAIGRAALSNGRRLELVVYGGAALMLAGNFRYATEDVDIAEIETPWPAWLTAIVADIATRNGWSPDWLNDAVSFHLSPSADRAADHIEFGTFPRSEAPGLAILVPTADYMLALKLKAMRVLDPAKGPQESNDIRKLMAVVDADIDGAIAILRRYFPRSAEDPGKQRFLLKQIMADGTMEPGDAPRYPR